MGDYHGQSGGLCGYCRTQVYKGWWKLNLRGWKIEIAWMERKNEGGVGLTVGCMEGEEVWLESRSKSL